jgi:hypothetical protein
MLERSSITPRHSLLHLGQLLAVVKRTGMMNVTEGSRSLSSAQPRVDEDLGIALGPHLIHSSLLLFLKISGGNK